MNRKNKKMYSIFLFISLILLTSLESNAELLFNATFQSTYIDGENEESYIRYGESLVNTAKIKLEYNSEHINAYIGAIGNSDYEVGSEYRYGIKYSNFNKWFDYSLSFGTHDFYKGINNPSEFGLSKISVIDNYSLYNPNITHGFGGTYLGPYFELSVPSGPTEFIFTAGVGKLDKKDAERTTWYVDQNSGENIIDVEPDKAMELGFKIRYLGNLEAFLMLLSNDVYLKESEYTLTLDYPEQLVKILFEPLFGERITEISDKPYKVNMARFGVFWETPDFGIQLEGARTAVINPEEFNENGHQFNSINFFFVYYAHDNLDLYFSSGQSGSFVDANAISNHNYVGLKFYPKESWAFNIEVHRMKSDVWILGPDKNTTKDFAVFSITKEFNFF